MQSNLKEIHMKTLLRVAAAIIASLIFIYISILSLGTNQPIDNQLTLATLIATPQPQVTIIPSADINELPFQDNMDVYKFDDPDSVVVMYVTVRRGNLSDNTDHTWNEVNDFTKWFYSDFNIVEVGKAEAIVQIGDKNGPIPGELGFGEVIPNATIQVRGASSSLSAQKSYKIELRNRAGEWRGQRTIALNKHVWDLTRARNKLSFDLLKEIPNMVSLRTQFVHLFIKDETSTPPSEGFVDYGLFTQVEQPNRRYLRSRLLDGDGQFYKPTFFEFHRYSDQIRLADDPLYDLNAFSSILEIKGSNDHTKLIQMLEDLNNYNLPIEQSFEKYFNAENYFTWLAFNILAGNIDTQSQNFYLYSPKNGEQWFFIPWDYDGSFYRQQRDHFGRSPYEYWEYGISNYWGSVLHNRVLRVDHYRDRLTEKIEELYSYLTPERLENMLNIYKPVVEPFISRMPDLYYFPLSIEEFDLQYSLIPTEIEYNYELYYESLDNPMPFFLGTPRIIPGGISLNWDESYDFDAQDIQYEITISKDWEFRDVVFTTSITNITYVEINMLDSGTYFWRVTATNEDEKTQFPFDYYKDAEGLIHPGMKYLYITPNGEILEE
jgi:spore coat protein H